MFSLIFLSLLGPGLAFSLPTRSEYAATIADEDYVLPGTSYPTFYDVRLFLDPDNKEYFLGDVAIRLFPTVNTSTIVLHAMAMNITEIGLFDDVNANVNILASTDLATDETHFLRVTSKVQLNIMQPYNLKIKYRGTFATNMFGIYVSTYERPGVGTVNLITSQLQPTFARRAFPCYDEPRYKAVFRKTIYAPEKYKTVRSNMPIRTDLLKPEVQGFKKYEFEDTVVQSSYLLAYLVSDFDFVSNEPLTPTGIFDKPFRVYSRPETQKTAEFALDYGQKNVMALQKYTKFDYALPKFDKAAVPDFAAGAMENWGLVIYREVALLVQDGVTTTSTKQNVGRIICHENLHMWFGNEVSPVSWTYTWLNEGFANFFENYGTDLVLPEWRMMDQYVLLLQNVLQNDAVLTINPMTHPVFTPSQIMSTFNAVAYQKSGSVIRMMQHFLTPEVFQQGLVYYLANNTRRAVVPPELYVHLQAALDESDHSIPWPLAVIMERWTTQGGFPVLTVRRSAPTAQSISISQQRYLTNPSLSSSTTWHVPVNWVLSTSPDFTDTRPQTWVPPTGPALAVDIPGLSDADWFIVNKQQASYYRVNYDDQNWRALARVLSTSHSIIHLLNRAQIVDDVFNMARNGRTSYSNAFDVSRYLINETDYIAWGSANNAFSYLDIVLSGSPAYDLFQAYILHFTGPSYDRLGFIAKGDEEHVTAFYRNIILNLNCRLGNERCVNQSQELLEQFRNNPSNRDIIKPDIQTTVFCSGLRGGSEANFNFLWERYIASQDSSEQSILLNALGCTSNATLRSFYLSQVIDANSAVREQDRHTILVSTINASPANMEAALDFVVENFAAIQPRVQQLTGTTNILNAFARRLTTRAHLTKIEALETQHAGIFTAGERASINDIKENIGASVVWSANNFDVVHTWLRLNYGSNASILTSGFLIIISIFVTWYNH